MNPSQRAPWASNLFWPMFNTFNTFNPLPRKKNVLFVNTKLPKSWRGRIFPKMFCAGYETEHLIFEGEGKGFRKDLCFPTTRSPVRSWLCWDLNIFCNLLFHLSQLSFLPFRGRQMSTSVCWELTCDGLVSRPGVVKDNHPLNTTETENKHQLRYLALFIHFRRS